MFSSPLTQTDKEINTSYFTDEIKTSNIIIQEIMYKSCKFHGEKTRKLIKEILLKIIKKQKDDLKNVCFGGLPDDLPILRSLIWKINLKYFNYEIDKWEIYTQKKRMEYEEIKYAFLLKMEIEKKLHEELEQASDPRDYSGTETNRKNKIQELQKFTKNTDKELLELIDNDVRRTHTDLNFFFMPCKRENLADDEVIEIVNRRRSIGIGLETKTLDDIYNTQDFLKYETHANVLTRILYIYAKLNPEIIYVQGMNEILAPIYYCFSFDLELLNKNTENQSHGNSLESDVFWTFSILMEDLKGIFMRKEDDSNEGLFKKVGILCDMLKIVDKDLFNHFVANGVEMSHFAFRWFILLFTQDFVLPDILRLWDVILSESNRLYFVYYVALGILKIKKVELMGLDFPGIITSLQAISHLNVELIFDVIKQIQKDYDKKIVKLITYNSNEKNK